MMDRARGGVVKTGNSAEFLGWITESFEAAIWRAFGSRNDVRRQARIATRIGG